MTRHCFLLIRISPSLLLHPSSVCFFSVLLLQLLSDLLLLRLILLLFLPHPVFILLLLLLLLLLPYYHFYFCCYSCNFCSPSATCKKLISVIYSVRHSGIDIQLASCCISSYFNVQQLTKFCLLSFYSLYDIQQKC